MNSSHAVLGSDRAIFSEKYESKPLHLPQFRDRYYIITKIFEPQSIVWNAHWCFLTRSICLNHPLGMMAKVAMPFVEWPTCCILGSHLFRAVDDHSQFKARPCDCQRAPEYKWMMVASKKYGHVTSWKAYSMDPPKKAKVKHSPAWNPASFSVSRSSSSEGS